MSVFPVSLSICATLISTVAVIGFPAEVYYHGTMLWLIVIGISIGFIVTAHVYYPIYYDLHITSIFEYLELRFNKTVRIMAVITYSFQILVFISVQLYASSITLSQVSGIPFWGTVILNGLVCMLYTSLGGMKAVLWADSLQLCLILCGSLALIIQGSVNLGGLGRVFEIAAEHDRIQFDEFDPNPTTRHSVWGLTIGMGFFHISLFSSSQHSVQRYLTLGTKIRGQGALYLNTILTTILVSIVILVGIVMFATYASCDPIKLGQVEKVDQMPAYLVVDLFGHLRGMSGLFIVTVIAAAMSTMSSGQNALAAVFLEDITKPIYKAVHYKPIPERFATNITKFFGIFFGLTTMVITFILADTKETILNIAWKLLGILGGPLFGMFTLGILFPRANAWIRPDNLPTDISGCESITYFNETSVE
ncbi:unnamed protein product, partial [Owenia fusiformis]